MKLTERKSVIEICAGAGGQSLGLESAGFDHLLAIELDPTAASTLAANRPTWKVAVGDVADKSVWDPADYSPEARDGGPVDLFAGGVPCPPFSIAGKQLGANDERDLFAWAVEQVGVIRPNVVLLENVKGLSQARFAAYRQHVLDRFVELGYEAEWRLLLSADFGVAQLRPRFVLIAMKPEFFQYFHWPEARVGRLSVGAAIGDLMGENGWEGAEAWMRNAVGIGPTLVGGSKKHGGADLGPTRAKTAWNALGIDGRGIADEAPQPGERFDVGPRLTLEMVARLQGWDNNAYQWDFVGRKTSVYRQIGNAFPPPVAHALGQAIMVALTKSGAQRIGPSVRSDVDPILTVLKTQKGFVNTDRLQRLAGVSLSVPDLEKRISAINHDFDVEVKSADGKTYYKLKSFRGFVGQDDHHRNDFLRKRRSLVS